MREKNDENIRENNEEQIEKDNNLLNIYQQRGQNSRLLSLDSLIEVKDENTLKTMDTLLRGGTYEEFDSSFNTEEEEDVEWSPSTNRIILNIKNYIFIFALLMSSSFNYSFLYLPFIIIGFILSFFLFSNKSKAYRFKQFSEYFGLIYSLLLLVFKIILIVLSKKENKKILDNKNLFINLGILLLKDINSNTYLVLTFIGESFLIIVSLVSVIISNAFIDSNLEDGNEKKKLSIKEMSNLLLKHVLINYFILLAFAIFNTSIFTLIYICIINIILFYIVKHSNIKKISLSFKFLSVVIYILIMSQIFLINLLNIYHYKSKLSSKKILDRDIYYSELTQLGISYMTNKNDLKLIFEHWTGYLFAVIGLLSFSSTNNDITFDRIYRIVENLNIEQDYLDENISQNIFIKILIKIKEYLNSPNFILHICRLFAIGYLYFFRNFFALIIFTWLLFSFLFLRINSNKKSTFIVIFTLLISLICFHIGNIDGFFESNYKIFSFFDPYHLCL